MGAAMDVRALVPRTPPEGMREWVLKACAAKLDRHGLVYEAAYMQDYGLHHVLDEWAVPKKIKMVRVTCSCCGECILDWAKDQTRGYGFVLPEGEEWERPWDEGERPRTVAAGDETFCPVCGEKVLVNKRSAIRDYYVTAECQVMSAGLVGDGLLCLTGWTAQRRVYKSSCERLELLPAEAYVFTQDDCFQLMGWRNGYSGTAGYFIQYTARWSQPGRWMERWGREEHIFGLTPELIDQSCLPHCKLDVYMAARPGAGHYPVAYLRLYQAHPNVEAVLLHGLPRVLDGLIAGRENSADWKKNSRGRMELPEIDWTQTRPAQMLGLTKEELRLGRSQCWDARFWRLFLDTKRMGELLTEKDMIDAFRLGDEHLSMLIRWGQVGKSIRYLLRQCEVTALEIDEADADPIPDAQLLTDYWTVAETVGRNLADPSVRYPQDLIAAHDRAMDLMRQKAGEAMAELFRIRRRVLRKYAYAAHGLFIRPAASQRELSAEGDALHHCVGTYGERHAKGETAIFFIRRTARPKEPYFTLELDEKTLTVRQNRGLRNCPRTPEVEAFEQVWLAWVRAGMSRGAAGGPAQGAARQKGAA